MYCVPEVYMKKREVALWQWVLQMNGSGSKGLQSNQAWPTYFHIRITQAEDMGQA